MSILEDIKRDIAEIRNETLEEAARAAEMEIMLRQRGQELHPYEEGNNYACHTIAERIRALKGDTNGTPNG